MPHKAHSATGRFKTPQEAAEYYEKLWGRYCKTLAEADKAMKAATESYDGPFSLPSVNTGQLLQEAAKDVVYKMVQIAQTHYAKPGIELQIKITDYYTKSGVGTHNFTPLKVSNILEEDFGDGKAAEIVYKKSAQVIIRHLNLNRNEPEFRGGKLIMRKSIITEASFRDCGKALAYRSQEEFNYIFSAFADFAIWCDDEEMAQWFRDQADYWYRNVYPTVESRKKMSIKGFTYTTFLKYFEFAVSSELTERFQIFISLYGGERLAKAA